MEHSSVHLEEDRVFLHLRNGQWNDSTQRIRRVSFCSDSIHVLFANGKTYRFSYARIKILKRAIPDPSFNARLLGASLAMAQPALYLSEGQTYLFDEKRGPRLLSDAEVQKIREICQTNDHLYHYYLALAKQSDSELEEESDFLSKQYGDLSKWPLDPSSVLPFFLHQKVIRKAPPSLIYPFPHNRSQMEAVEKAFSSNVSIIQGPPGTGKTQTILNLIANILYQGKTVAVISNNNLAVENVLEKMNVEGYGFLCAFLGNLDNRNRFFSASHPISHLLVEGDVQDPQPLQKFEKMGFESQSLLAALCQEKSALKKEYETQYSSPEAKSPKLSKHVSSEDILKLSVHLETRGKEKFHFFQRLCLKLFYGIPFAQTQSSIPDFTEWLNQAYGQRKLGELEQQIQRQQGILRKFKELKVYEREMERSQNALKEVLNRKSSEVIPLPYNGENFKDHFSSFIKRYPVLLSSTLSLSSSVAKNFLFDYLIMDEASQSTLVSIFPCLTKGKNIVIIGDDCQLPPVLTKETLEFEIRAAKKFKIPEEWRDKGQSFLSFAQNLPGVPMTLLKEHYRCAKQIIDFSNQRIYGGQLELERLEDGENHLEIRKTVAGNHARRNDTGGSGQYNQREIDEIVDLIQTFPPEASIGVITPYRRQAELLRNALPKSINAGTVHTFQGKEEQIIVLSTVANDAADYVKEGETIHSFVNDEHLINVAITRAKDRFVLVTSDKIASSNRGILADLVKYIRYQTHQGMEEGRIHSIFDLLYSEYAKVREKVSGNENVESEN